MRLHSLIPVALSAALLASAAAANTPETDMLGSPDASAKDISELRAFVASRPTPEEFQRAFPDVWLILPGDIVSRDVCSQYYRFLAEIDTDGRISGGNLE